MTKTAIKKPKPRKTVQGTKSATFQARVDYVAKALKRGSWGRKFDACFEHHDSSQLVATVMLRAHRNPALKKAIMTAFSVTRWDLVPWQEAAKPFAGKSARQIGVLATEARLKGEAEFTAIMNDPDLSVEKS
jgi:hypothetical protein